MKDEYIEWGDWKDGDEVVFCGFSNPTHDHWTFTTGNTYVVTRDGSSLAPLSEMGGVPICNWGFLFKRKKPDTPSEALQDTLASGDTDVPDQGENVSEGITEGVKYDQGKPRWSLIPWKALKEIVDVLTFGATKYSPDNWKKVDPERYKDAALRHFTAWLDGEKLDPETGKNHLAHLGCCILFLLWFDLTGEKDD